MGQRTKRWKDYQCLLEYTMQAMKVCPLTAQTALDRNSQWHPRKSESQTPVIHYCWLADCSKHPKCTKLTPRAERCKDCHLEFARWVLCSMRSCCHSWQSEREERSKLALVCLMDVLVRTFFDAGCNLYFLLFFFLFNLMLKCRFPFRTSHPHVAWKPSLLLIVWSYHISYRVNYIINQIVQDVQIAIPEKIAFAWWQIN